MHDIFSFRAKKIVWIAQEEARAFGREFVGPEHLFLAICRDADPEIERILRKFHITYKKARLAVECAVRSGQAPKKDEPLAEMPSITKIVFRLAVEEAQRFGSETVDTSHIFLAVLAMDEKPMTDVFSSMGLDPGVLRKDLSSKGTKKTNVAEKASATPMLDRFASDLVGLVRQKKIDPVLCRQEEIERVIQVLCRRTKNNPCLIGEPGVGKTAVVEGLAAQIVRREVPDFLARQRIMLITVSGLVAGARFRGEFEERLTGIIDETRKMGNIILFIDELHTIVGAGASEGSTDTANILKPVLARGEIQTIGATTHREYRRYIERDSALERRFQPVMVEEPKYHAAVEIVQGLKDKYEEYHDVKYQDEAVTASVALSSRYIPDRYLPDKAIDLMDEAGAMVRLENIRPDPRVVELEKQLKEVKKEEISAGASKDYKRAIRLHSYACMLSDNLDELRKTISIEKQNNNSKTVTEKEVAQVVSRWTGIPVARLTETESSRLLNLESELACHVMGQDEAIEAISRTIRRSRARISDPLRPTGTFLFLGPTGVGKTEIAKALATVLFGDQKSLIRVDMSEYSEKFAVSRLIGSPPGYVGYDEGGQLTERVRRRPYSVVLFDEVEKAHPELFSIMLQILDDGLLTDAQGKTVSFRNAIIILTSNAGSGENAGRSKIGFASDQQDNYASMSKELIARARRTFTPEFLNRLDDIVVFRPLSEEIVSMIVQRMLRDLSSRLCEEEGMIHVDDDVLQRILREGYDPGLGARPLRRAVQRMVEDPIADLMISGVEDVKKLRVCMEKERTRALPVLPS